MVERMIVLELKPPGLALSSFFFLFPLQFFSSPQKWNHQNYLLFAKLDGQWLLFFRTDSVLNVEKLQLVFDSSFLRSTMSFVVDEPAVKDDPREF